MKNKKFYVVLILTLFLSLGAFMISYSKESGQNGDAIYNDGVYDDFRVVFSSYEYKSDEEVMFTVTNNLNEDRKYSIVVDINGALGDVYYSLDGGAELPFTDRVIYEGNLASFGNSGDAFSHSLVLYSKSGSKFEYNVSVQKVVENTLEYNVQNDENVYLNNGIYRYYGESVNNYINFNGMLYQIISLSDEYVRLVSSTADISPFVIGTSYVTIDDYLASFGEDMTKENVGSDSSWLNNGYSYWLNGDIESDRYVVLNVGGVKLSGFGRNYFVRTTIDIPTNLMVISGNGTILSPYEVAYVS